MRCAAAESQNAAVESQNEAVESQNEAVQFGNEAVRRAEGQVTFVAKVTLPFAQRSRYLLAKGQATVGAKVTLPFARWSGYHFGERPGGRSPLNNKRQSSCAKATEDKQREKNNGKQS